MTLHGFIRGWLRDTVDGDKVTSIPFIVEGRNGIRVYTYFEMEIRRSASGRCTDTFLTRIHMAAENEDEVHSIDRNDDNKIGDLVCAYSGDSETLNAIASDMYFRALGRLDEDFDMVSMFLLLSRMEMKHGHLRMYIEATDIVRNHYGIKQNNKEQAR